MTYGRLLLAVVTLAAGLFSGRAQAQQNSVVACSSVLNQSSLWTDEFRANSAIQLIAYSRFLRSDYASAANDAARGFGVPTGQTVFGGAFDPARFQLRKEYLSTALFNFAVPEKREIDAALASGMPSVLAAWKACAQSQGGVAIRFDPQSPRDVIAYVEVFGNSSRQTKVIDDAALPTGVTAVTGGNCLKAGQVIKAGKPCVMVLSLPEATTTLLMALNTEDGIVMGYLPPRVALSSQSRPFPFTPNCNLSANSAELERNRCKDRLWKGVVASSAKVAHSVSIPNDLPTDLLGQGWEFDNASPGLNILVLDRYSPSNTSRCVDKVLDPKSTTFAYGYTLLSGTEHHQSAYITCMAHPSISLTRPVWIPQT